VNFRRVKTWRVRFLCVAVAAGALMATPVAAQTWGQILGGIINQAIVNNAVQKWNAVDPDVRQCLVNTYSLDLNGLAQQGITPDDYRLQNQMQYCNQQVAQARYQQQQQQRAYEEQQAALQRKIEAAQTAWNALDSQVRQCLTDRGIVPDQYANAGTSPDDYPVNAQVQSCQTTIAQAEEQQQQAEARHKQLVDTYGQAQADAIEGHTVLVGMSKDAVREALGAPDRVDTIPPDDEMWVYGPQRISISKGKVTYVGH